MFVPCLGKTIYLFAYILHLLNLFAYAMAHHHELYQVKMLAKIIHKTAHYGIAMDVQHYKSCARYSYNSMLLKLSTNK